MLPTNSVFRFDGRRYRWRPTSPYTTSGDMTGAQYIAAGSAHQEAEFPQFGDEPKMIKNAAWRGNQERPAFDGVRVCSE